MTSYHAMGNGGTECVNIMKAQMLACIGDERQDDWDEHLSYVEFSDSNCVNAAADLAPSEIHIGRVPRSPLAIFQYNHLGGNQSLQCDELECCDLSKDRQQCSI